jgi:hypothetical protein
MSIKHILIFLVLAFIISFFLGNITNVPEPIVQIINGIIVVIICAVILLIMKQLEIVKNLEKKKVKYLSFVVILVVVFGFHFIISFF